jgi:hypothetical protein
VDLSLGQTRLHWSLDVPVLLVFRKADWTGVESRGRHFPQSTEVESHDSEFGRSSKLKPYSIG